MLVLRVVLVLAAAAEGADAERAEVDGLKTGNKKENVAVIYTPADNLKVRPIFVV